MIMTGLIIVGVLALIAIDHQYRAMERLQRARARRRPESPEHRQ